MGGRDVAGVWAGPSPPLSHMHSDRYVRTDVGIRSPPAYCQAMPFRPFHFKPRPGEHGAFGLLSFFHST
jgi:hypothetical protein